MEVYMFDFVLPDLGEGMTEGEIRKWLVSEGDEVEEHQAVLQIETDKAVVDVPSPKKGRVVKITKNEGEIAKVGETLMTISAEGEEKASVSVVGRLPEEEEVLAAPSVRLLAKELGVKLEGLRGSGPGGSITKEDVTAAGAEIKGVEGKREAAAPLEERIPLRGIRRSIIKNLLATVRTYAQVTGMDEADLTELWELREREKAAVRQRGIHLTFVPFFIKAVERALAFHPLFGASIDEEKEEIIVKRQFNVGIAVNTPDGLMVPVIKNADGKTIVELAAELQELTEKAKERKIKLEDLKGGVFTITNYGSFGGTFATPIVNYPESAILGTGRISDRAWVKDGSIAIRKVLPLSLTFDHRITDGADAAKFLGRVIKYLEDPASIFIEAA